MTGFFSSCRCCKVHDKCYEASRKAPGCTAIADLPYVLVYDFTCSNQRVSCSGEMMLPHQVLSVFKLVMCGGILRQRQNAWFCSIYVTTAQTNAPAVLSLCILCYHQAAVGHFLTHLCLRSHQWRVPGRCVWVRSGGGSLLRSGLIQPWKQEPGSQSPLCPLSYTTHKKHTHTQVGFLTSLFSKFNFFIIF